MAGNKFHVHGAHEHEIQHQAHQGVGFSQLVAVFTAILSTLAVIVSYHGSSMQNEAMLLKNEAIIKQAEASDQWAFFQAKTNRAQLMDLASQLVSADKAKKYKAASELYESQRQLIKNQAETLEALANKANVKSEELLESHHFFSKSVMLFQIAISLASISALTRKRWLLWFAGIISMVGCIFAVFGWL